MAKKKKYTKEDIKEFAKKLYQEYDGDGKRTFSLRKICTTIAQQLHKEVTPNTIRNWANTPDKLTGKTWNDINQKAKALGIEKAKKETFSKEEQVIEKESDDIAELYKMALMMSKAGGNMAKIYYDYKIKLAQSLKDGTPPPIEVFDQKDAQIAVNFAKLGIDSICKFNDIPENLNVDLKLTDQDREKFRKGLKSLRKSNETD